MFVALNNPTRLALQSHGQGQQTVVSPELPRLSVSRRHFSANFCGNE